MVTALKKKKLLPALRTPKKSELASLGEFTGPLLAIALTRMAGFLNMQRKAMTLGVTALAGYQLCMNLLIFFILFGEPLSQLGQTKLPGLIEDGNVKEAMATLKSILLLSVFAAVGVGAAACLTSFFGPGLFSLDLGVQAVARSAAPMLFLAVSMTILGIAIDGAMMASRDFGFMLGTGIFSFFVQAKLLEYCGSVQAILATCKFIRPYYACLILDICELTQRYPLNHYSCRQARVVHCVLSNQGICNESENSFNS